MKFYLSDWGRNGFICSRGRAFHPKCLWWGLSQRSAGGNVFKAHNSRETGAGEWEFKVTLS